MPFGVPLVGVDCRPPRWRRQELELKIGSRVIQGDMRQSLVLERAGVRHCRAVLLLSSDSQVNLEAALQVRLLNPHAEIVVRSSSGQMALGRLLEQRLPKVAVVDPIVLTAGAVANAIHPTEGLIPLNSNAGGNNIRLVNSSECSAQRGHRPVRRQPSELHPLWLTVVQRHAQVKRRQHTTQLRAQRAARWIKQTWRGLPRSQMSWLLPMSIGLITAGVVLFSDHADNWQLGLMITFGLLKGEYVDPVMLLSGSEIWRLLLGMSYSLIGTLITSAFVALILEKLLSNRLGLRRRVYLRTGSRQALIVDGQQVVEPIRDLLASEQIGVQTATIQEGMSELETQLERLRHTELVGIGLLSNNLLSNVHAAMALQSSHRPCRIAVLAHEMESSDQLGALLGGITVLSGVDLAADALVATAFGERVERVLQIKGMNHMVVRYQLEEGDTLCGLNISRLENGYQLNVLTHSRADQVSPGVLPPLDCMLMAGDEITVLADLESLRLVEIGALHPAQWRVDFRVIHHFDNHFMVQQCLAKFLGSVPGRMHDLVDGHWHHTPPLDNDLGEILCEQLQRMGVEAHLRQVQAEAASMSCHA